MLIAGATGWLGSAVLATACRQGKTALGFARNGNESGGIVAADAGDLGSVMELCERFRPTVMINCVRNVEDGVNVTRCLLDGAQRVHARLLHVGSAAEYGDALRRGRPVGERAAERPTTAYGRGKAAEAAVAAEGLRERVDVVVGRLFNLIGPGEPEGTVAGDWVRRLVAPSAQRQSTAEIPAAVRDFTDIRDAADALLHLACAPRAHGFYNVCSGRGVRIDELVRMIARECHVPLLVRGIPVSWGTAAGVPRAVGVPAKINRLGWKPRISLRRSVRDLVHGVRS